MAITFHFREGESVKLPSASTVRRCPTDIKLIEAVDSSGQVWGTAVEDNLDCAESTAS